MISRSFLTMLICLFPCLFSSAAMGYIPEYSMILGKAAGQHGKGIYQIEQDVTFQGDSESFAIKETWLVQNEGSMRVRFEGRGILKGVVQGVHVYDSTKRFYVDASGASRVHKLTEDWLKPFLVFRSSKYARSRLVSMKIAPAESLYDRPPLATGPAAPAYTPPTFLYLSRVGGSIAYGVGAVGAPSAWIAQDQFVFRKVRTPSQVTWRADDYAKESDGFWYPKMQTYSWGPYTVTIQTLSVKAVAQSSATTALFNSSSLGATDAQKLPDANGLREFFSRFR